MNILLIGSGGREHAFAWKINESPLCDKLYIAPGNAGTEAYGINIPLNITDFQAIKNIVLKNNINMVIIGPEEPLVKGIHDFFLADEKLKNIPVIGPQKAGAQLEGSKDFAKRFMQKHGIPTAAYQTFDKDELEEGFRFLETLQPPYVLKADGLAAGKGVVIHSSLKEAKMELHSMLMKNKFGEAGRSVVIEEFLKGIELSVFVITDGSSYKILPPAKDYKRVGKGDTGPNTGGMGAVSPVPFADRVFMDKVEQRIVIPTVNGLKQERIPYKGFIFIGLMNVNGDPYVIEYNVRMGDPETEVVVPRLKSDIVKLFLGVAEGTLEKECVEIDERTAVTVMLVSKGYPGEYEKGKEITGLEKVSESILFHAGTVIDNGTLKTNGGRVLAVTSYGTGVAEAAQIAFNNAEKITFEGKYYRTDIGTDLL